MTKPTSPQEPRDITAPLFFVLGMVVPAVLYVFGSWLGVVTGFFVEVLRCGVRGMF